MDESFETAPGPTPASPNKCGVRTYAPPVERPRAGPFRWGNRILRPRSVIHAPDVAENTPAPSLAKPR